MPKINQRGIWIILGITAILFRVILSNFPELIEQYYSRGIFVLIRYLIDYTIGLLPIPFIYVLIILALGFAFSRIFRKNGQKRSWKNRVLNFGLNLVTVISGLVFLFLFLWGFNYSRVPIETQIGIKPVPLEKKDLRAELMAATEDLLKAFQAVSHLDSSDFEEYVSDPALEKNIRQDVESVFNELGYPVPGRVRARNLYPKGSLLRISTAGFYLPLTGECHVDPGLHPLQIPYVMSHEMGHGLGLGDEGSCNFIAYLTCQKSEDPFMNYGGALSYWRSVAAQYIRFDREDYLSIRATLPTQIIEHMRSVNRQMDKYPDIFPAIRDATYNAYLKTQGIEEGMKNYSRVILLVTAYRNK